MTDSGRNVELRLRAAVESSPSGLLMVDERGIIVLVNREIERMFDYPREELLGKSVDLLVPERVRSVHSGYRSDFFARPSVRAMGVGRDLYGRRKDGTEVPLEIGLTPVATEEGLFVLSSIVDISARKRAEQEQNRLQEQLRHAQKLEAVGTLAGGMAHDFNNLLAVIMGCGDLLRDSIDDPDAKADLTALMEAATRGKELVSRVLTFSRRQDISRRPLELGQTVEEAVKLLRATLPATIEIRVRADAAVPRVLGDTTAIHQIVMNLGTNAAHAMPQGGQLAIFVEPHYLRDSVARAVGLSEGAYARVIVRDTGHGIDPAIRDRVFEPFFTTKTVGAGTGLGLALVHGIMREHEGHVALESEPGRGTTVTCLFPAVEDSTVEAGNVASEVPHGKGQKILFVDDEPALVRVGTRQLERLGYDVVSYTRVADALAAFRADPDSYDLVVTDYNMSEHTGVDFSREIKGIRPELPVLLLTGQMEAIDERILADSGVRRVATKPLTLEGLAVVVHDLLVSVAGN